MPKPTIINATTMQQKTGQILRRAFQEGEHFIVTRDGYPVVAIIPVGEYETNRHQEANTHEPTPPRQAPRTSRPTAHDADDAA